VGPPVTLFSSPALEYVMPPISDFVDTLSVAGKPFKEIEEMVKTVYWDKALKKNTAVQDY
jgi:hypothetical protein